VGLRGCHFCYFFRMLVADILTSERMVLLYARLVGSHALDGVEHAQLRHTLR
jgi:hypothetical protein